MLVTVLHTFPFVYLLTSSALQSVDASYEEAAQILGAGKWRTALTITGPLVAPAILSGTLLAFVNAIALFGSQAIIGLPGRIFTLPTRIYALFDYPPRIRPCLGAVADLRGDHGRGALSAARLPRPPLLRDAGRQGRAAAAHRPRHRRAGCCSASASLVFIVAILLPYRTLIAVSFSKSWGLDFWKSLTLANYTFVLFEYDVTQRAIVNSLMLAVARRHHRRRARRHDRLDRPAHQDSLAAAARLCRADPARPARHRHGGGADPVLAARCRSRSTARSAILLLAYVGALHSARRARRQRVAAPGRPVARGKRAHPRRVLGHDHARGDAAADPARPVRRLAAGVRAGDPGAERVDPAVQLGLDHARRRRLQSLRDRLYRAGRGARHRQHGDHRRRDLAREQARRRIGKRDTERRGCTA